MEALLKYSRTGQVLKSGGGLGKGGVTKKNTTLKCAADKKFTRRTGVDNVMTATSTYVSLSTNAPVKNTLHSGSFALEGGQT